MNEFTIIDIYADANNKTFTATASFNIKEDTINSKNIKIYEVSYSFKDTETGQVKEVFKKEVPCELSVNGKDIKIKIDHSIKSEYYILISNLYDKLGRSLFFAYDKYIRFINEVQTKLSIDLPTNQFVSKSKNVEFKIAISDLDTQIEEEVDKSDIAIFVLEIATTSNFFNSETIKISRSDGKYFALYTSVDGGTFTEEIVNLNSVAEVSVSNNSKYHVSNLSVNLKDLTFTLSFNKDEQYFVRSRVENSLESIGDNSEVVSFIVKAESLLDKEESYMDTMLYSEELFKEPYIPCEMLNKTEDAYTNNEFYMEFNKPVLITNDSLVDSEGLIYIGKCTLVRRDL